MFDYRQVDGQQVSIDYSKFVIFSDFDPERRYLQKKKAQNRFKNDAIFFGLF